jgi:hypothetical protein
MFTKRHELAKEVAALKLKKRVIRCFKRFLKYSDRGLRKKAAEIRELLVMRMVFRAIILSTD